MGTSDKLNLTMLCDFYELTMSQGYFENGYKDRQTNPRNCRGFGIG